MTHSTTNTAAREVDKNPQKLVVATCRHHGFYSVSIDDKDCGIRVTPNKCCGSWTKVREWELSGPAWRQLARLATQAADETEGLPPPTARSAELGGITERKGDVAAQALAWIAVTELLNEVDPDWVCSGKVGTLAAVESIRKAFATTLTQQQGDEQAAGDVEQEARELLYAETAKAYAEPFGGPIIQHDIAIRAITAALRSKPAASEGDGRALLELIGDYWALAYAEGAEGRLHDTPKGDAQACLHEIQTLIKAITTPANTSKQAAGEAVAWLCNGEVWHSEQEARDCWNPGEAPIIPLYTTPPRHPADEGARDSERLDYIERTFSGMTNRERYLPVQMIWGKGCNGRTLREACDKYMAKESALGKAGSP